jgi:hypothetical protein
MIQIKSRWESRRVLYTAKDASDVHTALQEAVRSGADLSGAYLSGAYLSGADLSGAYLRSAQLRSADLSGAYLSGAKQEHGARIVAAVRAWEAKWQGKPEREGGPKHGNDTHAAGRGGQDGPEDDRA